VGAKIRAAPNAKPPIILAMYMELLVHMVLVFQLVEKMLATILLIAFGAFA